VDGWLWLPPWLRNSQIASQAAHSASSTIRAWPGSAGAGTQSGRAPGGPRHSGGRRRPLASPTCRGQGAELGCGMRNCACALHMCAAQGRRSYDSGEQAARGCCWHWLEQLLTHASAGGSSAVMQAHMRDSAPPPPAPPR
jgi:hypothetical protein